MSCEADVSGRVRKRVGKLLVGSVGFFSLRSGDVPGGLGLAERFASPREFPKAADCDVFLGVAMLPVADQDAFAVMRRGDADRAK